MEQKPSNLSKGLAETGRNAANKLGGALRQRPGLSQSNIAAAVLCRTWKASCLTRRTENENDSQAFEHRPRKPGPLRHGRPIVIFPEHLREQDATNRATMRRYDAIRVQSCLPGGRNAFALHLAAMGVFPSPAAPTMSASVIGSSVSSKPQRQ